MREAPDRFQIPQDGRPLPKLGGEKLTPEEQRRRFIEAAREAGAGESEAAFARALGAIVKAPANKPS